MNMPVRVQKLLESRAFQLEDFPWFYANPRSMILYDPRLGKTVMTTALLLTDPLCSKILILASKNAIGVWLTHLQDLHKQLACTRTMEVRLVRGDAFTRHLLYEKPRTAQITVYLTTFGSMDRDYQFLQLPSSIKAGLGNFDTVIGDEIHLRWRNRKNKAVAYAKWLTRSEVCRRFHPLSGSLASKGGPTDYWAILNMIDPKLFASFWRFAGTWCEIIDNGYGKEIIGPRNLPAFHKMMSRYARIRIRSVVAPQMPKVTRELVHVDMTSTQRRLFEALHQDMYTFREDGSMIVVTNSLETNTRFRQICACPAILGEEFGVGAAVEDIIERLADTEATEADRHVVIYLYFKAAMPHVAKALYAAGFTNISMLYGGIELEDQAKQIDQFRRSKGIMLCTVHYAQAFSLVPSEVCYFVGYSYDPGDNRQAEDRLVPQTGINPITAYYYCCNDSPDIQLADTVNLKNKRITLTTGAAKPS